MLSSVRIEELPWTAYHERVRDGEPVVFLPVGSLEQHGPHLPMNCDVVIPAAIAERAAERIGGLVAPAIAYGYKSQPRSGGGQHFPGTTSLDGATLVLTIRDVMRELARHGVRKLAVLIGHYENTMFVIEGIDVALRELRWEGIRDFKVVRADYWEYTTQATFEQVWGGAFPGWATEHAGVMETSLMLALKPDLVDMTQAPAHGPANFPPYDIYPYVPQKGWVPDSGALCSPRIASAEKGRLFLEDYVTGVVRSLAEEFRSA
jgi:creatinine amidohydrolase